MENQINHNQAMGSTYSPISQSQKIETLDEKPFYKMWQFYVGVAGAVLYFVLSYVHYLSTYNVFFHIALTIPFYLLSWVSFFYGLYYLSKKMLFVGIFYKLIEWYLLNKMHYFHSMGGGFNPGFAFYYGILICFFIAFVLIFSKKLDFWKRLIVSFYIASILISFVFLHTNQSFSWKNDMFIGSKEDTRGIPCVIDIQPEEPGCQY